ncbi:MAG TPA: hypothetical protein RMH85_11370 [Polyangiaceae bacterium LLY-WYZ-15_(1-7)]|nr:hypothetical protein [Myxococcales bacterium]MAT29241.1 hypothetical protein [Sandaracinus sp.]HJK90482.1 hypothetical protein [Polyangiaceae bacterium LLY-WYZ-15_(1-7)]MBJ74452.1 hypothetical protein [Sandaracinus sp.]HJL01247.1 hypothetical protein [Polyangiaceae bacterium LLY-WYZ-15_(1-7)]
MSKHYNNVPMSKEMADKVERQDESWTGPKLIALLLLTLGVALTLLYMMANNIIGPTIHQ